MEDSKTFIKYTYIYISISNVAIAQLSWNGAPPQRSTSKGSSSLRWPLRTRTIAQRKYYNKVESPPTTQKEQGKADKQQHHIHAAPYASKTYNSRSGVDAPIEYRRNDAAPD